MSNVVLIPVPAAAGNADRNAMVVQVGSAVAVAGSVHTRNVELETARYSPGGSLGSGVDGCFAAADRVNASEPAPRHSARSCRSLESSRHSRTWAVHRGSGVVGRPRHKELG